MTNALARAAAIERVLADGATSGAHGTLAEAAISCSLELLEAGEAQVALDLVKSAEASVGSSGLSKHQRVRLELVQVRALHQVGSNEESLARTRRLLVEFASELEDLPSERSRLTLCEAANLWILGRADEAVAKLETLRAELLSKPDSYELAWCSLQLSSAEFIRGDRVASRRHVLDALVSARRCGSVQVEGWAQNNLDRLERQLCRWASAEEASSEAIRIFDTQGWGTYANSARRSLAITLWKRGSLGRALQLARECGADAAARGDRLQNVFASLLEVLIMIHMGDLSTADKRLQSLTDFSPDTSRPRAALLTTEFLGDVHLEQGNVDEALRYYDEVWPKAMALVPKGDIVAELRRRRAEVYYLQGHSELAYSEAKGGLEHCRELGDRYEEAATYRVLALAAAALGRADEARRWFDQGFAYYDDIETPYEWGKLWLAYGDWLNGPHAGAYADRIAALEAYHAARDHFERMGARGRLAETNKLIATLKADATPTSAELARKAPHVLAAADTPRHALRRPRGASELDRRSDWARQMFGLITRNKQMLHILEDVAKLAASRSPILVLGESGTGKELVASGIHALSKRKGAYIPINCGSLPREIIESELFGHVSGSFTGATRDKAGLVEVCDGGTIFLDEIAEMSVELQSRLLRFLETGESRRVGSTRNIAVDTRIVAATNRRRNALEGGDGFRPDLYYRLAHAVITLPPLRRRGDDTDLLIEYFLALTCEEEGKRVELGTKAWERLRNHPWPGNVRQLRAAIKRLVLLAAPGHEVEETDLQLDEGQAPANLLEELEQAERERLSEALASARGSRTEAARSLGIPRTTFINKMKRYGLS